MSIFLLLKERKFLPLFLTQFFGAFNDNAFKLAMLTLISYQLSHSQIQSEYYQAVAGVLYILPFFIFSATSGQLADKYDKALITRWVKIFELLLIAIGAISFYQGNIILMMLTLTGMGIHSTFFGPIKYAILPDHLAKKDLLGATGLIEASTFISILLGTTFGALAVGVKGSSPSVAAWMIFMTAFLGFIASLFIPRTIPALIALKVDFNLWRATVTILRQAKNEAGILLPILLISWFWLLGSVLLTKLPDYTHYVLGADTGVFSLFLALFSIGIAAGSMFINRILRGRVTLSIVPIAMLALTVFTVDLYWASPTGLASQQTLMTLRSFFSVAMHWRVTIDLFMLSFCGGLFVVPLYTYLQIASPPENRARIIAANNIYNALFMVLGALFVMLLVHLHIAIPVVFLIIACINALFGALLYRFQRKRDFSLAERRTV